MLETTPELRRADDRDVAGIHSVVASAYVGYTELIGRTPIPMLTDYATAVREHEVWVLDADGVIVGVLELVPRHDHLWLENVAVEPAWQGRGLGRRLMDHAEDAARQRGFAEVGLLTNERYADDIALYLRRGYRETHREPHLGTDLVYFRKTIGPAPSA
jgi:GNAT superfamily N-acetyltransferase